ncbi:MAG TPA: M20/M25/M40 family metallo-hydrolase [Candidatus Acidoferrales bacterium]|nr:M20/M25/M40 family metallo-hydrolase [Candidatus Acidoferrales bacterium]
MPTARWTVTLCLAWVLTAQAPVLAQSSSAPAALTVSNETREAVRQLLGESLLNGKAYAYDEQLADGIGPRLTGSANYMRAAAWAVEQFKSLGLADVHTEEWTIPATWEPDGPATGHLISPVDHPLHIYSLGWSPSTPNGGITADVVYVSSMTIDGLNAQKDQITGRIALFDRASFGDHPTIETQLRGLEHLRSLSPIAVLSTGGAKGAESESSLDFSGGITRMAQAQIGLEDSLLIRRLLAKGRVTMQFTLTNRIRENVPIPNVIGEIPGTERPDEVVIVGAHLDSWQPGTGAQDNGTGVASVLEAARAIQALHRPARRTIRFVLFGGEEEGLLGSHAYVNRHLTELPNIDAVLVTDSGSQPARGWYVMGREDERPSLAAISPLLEGLGANGVSSNPQYIYQTDHADFDLLGVPTLVLWNDQDIYDTLHHKANDTFDSVVEKDLTQGATMVTVTAYGIADSREPFAAHLSAADVRSMLEKAGELSGYSYLKSIGAVP